MNSILARARRADIVDEPFPHLVIHDALEHSYYEQLAAEFPAAEIILGGRQPVSNAAFRYAANDALDDERISLRWREFIRYHVSQAFFNEVCAMWGPQIRALHPHLEAAPLKPLDDWKSSVRFREPLRDIALECQFAYGAPVDRRSRTIGPHVDRDVALFAGLFYMRDDADDSEGGDLELYTFNGQPVFESNSRCAPDDKVTCFRTIRYARNTCVFFLHCHKSVHGVSPRAVTTYPRRHINFVGEIAGKVFDIRASTTFESAGSSDKQKPID